jgi:phage tail tube protein FII
VGGVVRVKAPGMIREMVAGSWQQVAGMIEYYDGIREQRTGSTRYNQGMDADSLNKTATGISIIQNASTQRAELVARQFAEFLREVFRKLLKLVSTHQDKAEVIRLRGEWVEIDPREWKNGFDMSVAVGLGTGNKDQVVAHLTNLLQIDKQIVELQGGANGPLLTMEGIYNKLKRMVEAMDLKGIEQYYNDPKTTGATAARTAAADPIRTATRGYQGAHRRTGEDRSRQDRRRKGHYHRRMQPPPELMAPGTAGRAGAPGEAHDLHEHPTPSSSGLTTSEHALALSAWAQTAPTTIAADRRWASERHRSPRPPMPMR